MRKRLVAAVGVAIFIATPARAQTKPDAAAAPPGGIPVGPLTVYPGVDLAQGYDDNLFLRPTNRAGSSFTLISPYARAEMKSGPHKFDLTFRINDTRYNSSAQDSFTDYSLAGNGDMVFSGRAGLRVLAEYRHGHDPRGSTDRGVSPAPDEYDNSSIDATFRYGAPGAQGRIEVNGNGSIRRYVNNRATTNVADRDANGIGGTFFWRVMPRTELLAQASQSYIDYPLPTSTQDSTESRLLFGAKWEATAATSGTAKFGWQTKKFDTGGRQDFSGSSWDVGVRWSPLTYSVFDFVSSKQTSESTGVGDAVVGTNYGVTWSHAWNSRLRTQVLASTRNDAFPGTNGNGRRDNTTAFGLKVGYDFRRWLRLGAELTHTERNSNDNNLDYRRNLLLFTVGGTL